MTQHDLLIKYIPILIGIVIGLALFRKDKQDKEVKK